MAASKWWKLQYATNPEFRAKVIARAAAWRKAHPKEWKRHQQTYNVKRSKVSDAQFAAAVLTLHWGGDLTWEEVGASILCRQTLKAPTYTVIGADGRKRKEHLAALEKELAEWEATGKVAA
jgi:hypothetical protein